MDTLVTTLTPFGDVILSLRRMRAPKLADALDTLTHARAVTASARILQEIAPAALDDVLVEGCGYLFDPDSNPLLTTALNAISQIAPLDDQVEMDLLDDGGGTPYLLPAPAGFPMGWDEWDEWLRHLDDHDDAKFFIFWQAIRRGEGELLSGASRLWGWWEWGLEIPDEWPDEIDWEKLDDSLRKRGMECFIRAYEICQYNTGNPYFDWNPYDDDGGYYGDPAEDFTIEGVRRLEKYWQDAQPYMADYRIARQRFDDDPSLAGKLLALYLKSAKKKPRVRVRSDGRTLAEIWGRQTDQPEGDTDAVDEVLRDTGLFEEGLYDDDDDDPENRFYNAAA